MAGFSSYLPDFRKRKNEEDKGPPACFATSQTERDSAGSSGMTTTRSFSNDHKRGQGNYAWTTAATAQSVAMPFPSENNLHGKVAEIWKKVEDYEKHQWTFESVSQVEAYIQSLCPWQRDMCFGILRASRAGQIPHMFLNQIMPGIIRLAAKLPRFMDGLKTLNSGETNSLTLPKSYIASLLANAFLCTFPHRNNTSSDNAFRNFPSINFNGLFMATKMKEVDNTKVEKLKCLIQYFCTRLKMPDDFEEVEAVTFTRVHLSPEMKPNWAECTKPMKKFKMQHLEASMDEASLDGAKCIQVDFANANIGGGVLGNGCLQEEIKFVTCPELIVARLFTEKLADDEALVIQGVQQYVNFQGYQKSFQFMGPICGSAEKQQKYGADRILVAIDATDFAKPQMGSNWLGAFFHRYRNYLPQGITDRSIQSYLCSSGLAQYTEPVILRELNKAYAGFRCEIDGISPDLPVATGNWGGGCYKGDPFLKGVIQHLAASAAGRDLLYFPFKDANLVQLFQNYKGEGMPIGEAYKMLLRYAEGKIDKDLQNRNLSNKIRGATSTL